MLACLLMACLLMAGLLVGCGGSVTPSASSAGSPLMPAPATVPPADRARHRSAAQANLDAVTAAVVQQDRAAFDARMSRADPAFAATASMLWRNLQALRPALLELKAGARETPLSAPRRAVLGADAWVQQVHLRWQLSGEPVPAEHQVWVTFTLSDGAAAVTGVTDSAPGPQPAQPVWWSEPVTVASSAGSTAVVAQGTAAAVGSATGWAARAAAAAGQVARRVTPPPTADWDGHLVLEVPSDQEAFDRALGVAAGSYARIAAVAWPDGPTASSAALRIVVNAEAVQDLSAEGLAILLAHEATHVATRSPGSAAPTWVVEGFADFVAYDAYPRTRAAAAAELLARVQASGPPASLPAADQFGATAPGLDLAYAQAWLACRFAAETYSTASLAAFYTQVDSGTAVDAALRSAFGLSEAAFTRGWRQYLQMLSRDR